MGVFWWGEGGTLVDALIMTHYRQREGGGSVYVSEHLRSQMSTICDVQIWNLFIHSLILTDRSTDELALLAV